MSQKKILYISQEIYPYLDETPISNTSRYLPHAIQDRGFVEIRIDLLGDIQNFFLRHEANYLKLSTKIIKKIRITTK